MKAITRVIYIKDDFAVDDFANKVWFAAETLLLTKYWSGECAPPERTAAARLLWSDTFLCVRFDCQQHEPFVINQHPQIDAEAEKLWERDVCELFIAPERESPEKYFEFEVAPTGEWLDYAVRQLSGHRETDTTYNSGMKTAALVLDNSFSVIFAVGWQALGEKPKIGDEWAGNLFRCVGVGATRGYLAWQPTLTAQPNFHVPEVFGTFRFGQ